MSNIELNGTYCRTLEAYKDEFRRKGLVPDLGEYPVYGGDFPRDYVIGNRYLEEFNATVDPEKRITKQITSMIRQPVTVTQKDGTRIVKDALYFNGWYRGFNAIDIALASEFNEGYFLKPRLQFQITDTGNAFDPKTGKPRGDFKVAEDIYEHYIFLPEDKKERRKFLEDILEKYPDTVPEELNLQFRQGNPKNNHQSQHGGDLNWDQFCSLSIKELSEVQKKGYYTDSNNITKDKDGERVEWNKNTGKMGAIR